MKSRIYFMFIFLGLLWLGLLGRGAFLQVAPNDRLKALQERQFQTVITLQSRRGIILDRNGRDLAISMAASSLYADPKLLDSKKHLSRRLAKELGVPSESIFAKIKDPKKRFVWIQRQIDPEKAARIKAWDIRGLSFVDEFKRIYPNENLLAQTLGFVGSEGQGLEGVELALDEKLRGNKKKVSVRRDARGRPLVADGMMFADNQDGAEVRLTIDAEVQHILETELHQSVVEFDADQAFGIILEAETSAIVAMASAPGFDANTAAKIRPDLRRNRAITDAFEPGSTMKTFVVAKALHEKILAPNSKYNTENGFFKVGDKVIREADTTHKWGSLTVSEILAYSSNIGTTKIAFDLGAEKVREGLEDFGFGGRLGIDIPGEARGSLQELPWRPHLLANTSFGHGVAVTPLQIANAYAAIANGGKLSLPHMIQSVRDPETGELIETKPKVIRQVITAEESAQMRLMLMGVTAPGATGVNAKVDGFLVAGKTGTAQKVNPNGKGYLDKAYISSFAGMIPANDPKYVIYVAVDHPKKNAYYGSAVAAPLFSRLAGFVARKAGLAPGLLSEKNLTPEAPALEKPKDRILASTSTSTEIMALPALSVVETVPDLNHLTLREVMQKISGQDLQLRLRGQGLVAEMDPPAGSPLPADKKITIFLR